jgi:hypothetical protein
MLIFSPCLVTLQCLLESETRWGKLNCECETKEKKERVFGQKWRHFEEMENKCENRKEGAEMRIFMKITFHSSSCCRDFVAREKAISSELPNVRDKKLLVNLNIFQGEGITPVKSGLPWPLLSSHHNNFSTLQSTFARFCYEFLAVRRRKF